MAEVKQKTMREIEVSCYKFYGDITNTEDLEQVRQARKEWGKINKEYIKSMHRSPRLNG